MATLEDDYAALCRELARCRPLARTARERAAAIGAYRRGQNMAVEFRRKHPKLSGEMDAISRGAVTLLAAYIEALEMAKKPPAASVRRALGRKRA